MEKIDLVVPYVDMSDPMWLQLAKGSINQIYTTRFRGQGDFFKYFFRCIDKNLPWINNIFLIVQMESQVPKWLNTSKVKIILHKDFIPKEFLPVYSSCTIEMFLPQIEGLSNKFIYFNDDIFVLNKLIPEHFFKENKVLQNFNAREVYGIFGYHVKNSYKLVFDDDSLLIPEHGIKPLFKDKCLECYSKYKTDILKSITTLRAISNMNVYLYSYYLKKLNLVEDSVLKFSYIDNYDYKVFRSNTDVLCINDSSPSFNIYENIFINSYFSSKYANKSKYEL